jgi:acyl-CoA reductase-like NAD-dependent aldehyde dehydrogenase
VNFVPGGREIGAYLVQHPRIDKVAFTGSTPAGRAIAEVCGRLLRPVTLELGGKSAAIFLDDAELANAAEALVMATLLNNGQTCILSTRILAPRTRYDEIVGTFAAIAGGLKVGPALEETTQIGPMASKTHRERVLGYIEQGKADGARVVAGGGAPADLDRGWFVSPTIFADVDPGHTIAREEIFGPVLAVIPYDTVDEAVAIANDSPYGLAGTVWSGDPDHALSVARRVQTGAIGINHFMLDPAAPFGGVKDSGLGKELGPEGLVAYQRIQTVYLTPPTLI